MTREGKISKRQRIDRLIADAIKRATEAGLGEADTAKTVRYTLESEFTINQRKNY